LALARSSLGWGRLCAAGALLFVAWRVVTLGIAEHWASLDPMRSIAVRADDPRALREAANLRLGAGALDEAADLARHALRADPLPGGPWAVLARIAEQRGDSAQARREMERALEHSPQDAEVRAWLADDALRHHDTRRAIALYDRLLRISPDDQRVVFRVLDGIAADAEGRDHLIRLLKAAPPWRASFLVDLARVGEAPVVDAFFAGLRDAALDAEVRRAYLDRLIADQRFRDAFDVWVAQVSPAGGASLTTPVNGDFEAAVTSPPFDWSIESPDGIEAGMRSAPDTGGRALEVQFFGRRSAFHHVRQLLQLPVGSHRLTWRYRLDELTTARGLRWVVDCATNPTTRIAASDLMRGDRPWSEGALRIDVPAGCGAQWLRLELDARIPAETLAYGTAWFDDLQIETGSVKEREHVAAE
jgi:tetratricopeptide (TPR) repeat protein